MFLSVAQPNTCSKPVQKLNALKQQSDDSKFLPWQHYSRLQGVIEGFVDGVLILSDRGEWVYANTQARRICHSLSPEVSQSNAVAQEIWRVCQSLIDSHQIFPRETIIIESEVVTDGLASYRIRVRWLESDASQHSFLLVTLEDLHQSLENMAIADVKKYGLTPREAEVWLLRRSNYSYKEIAAKLDITSNTVKKHMKSIYAKQQMSEWDE